MKRLLALLALVAAASPARAASDAPHAAAPAPARALTAAPHAASAAAPRPATAATGSSVFTSKHNLSVSGPGSIKAASETRVCIFCHTSHMGAPGATNRPAPGAALRRYSSSTMASTPAAPSRGTRSCLSCHDGTIAVGETVSGRIRMLGEDHLSTARSSNIGTDLRRTHPVAVRPALSPRLKRQLRDDASHPSVDATVECTSCHDPHRENGDPQLGKFLLRSNRQSALCTSCHDLPGWKSNPSAHATSQKSTAPADANAAGSAGYGTVADDACQSCHQNHAASEKGWLLRTDATASDDDVCLRCHNGSVARLDIRAEVQKPVGHAARPGGPSGHDPSEGRPGSGVRLPELSAGAPRHATCADCHDGHAAYSRPAQAPFASGALAGVWGIDRNGARVESVRYEYEVCFKCHGDSANQPQARASASADSVRRRATDVNLRRAFDPTSPSYHPVEAPGRGSDVPSLVAPLTTASIVYCSDCHASDRAGAPRGPHGSTFAHLLERNYTTADHTPEGPAAYALCYKCHDREVLLSERSAFNLHRKHVVDQSAPCSACHASHGVSSQTGTPASNAHLVDFDVSIVKPSTRGPESYRVAGVRTGSCNLSCHGKDHDNAAYSPTATSATALKLRAAQGRHTASAAPAVGGGAVHKSAAAPKR
jgi:predicted CXXCH cytochrome family protein